MLPSLRVSPSFHLAPFSFRFFVLTFSLSLFFFFFFSPIPPNSDSKIPKINRIFLLVAISFEISKDSQAGEKFNQELD